MTKKLVVIDSDNKEIIEAIKKYFIKKDVDVIISASITSECDLVVLTGFENSFDNNKFKVLNIFPSLLPAFKGKQPIKDAFLTGVKISGVSIHEVGINNFYGRILAQYPVLIGNTTHIDELTREIITVGVKLYPIVIDAVLNDKVFDFSDFFNPSCSGGCGSCGKCH